jgi:putative aldouronate transport system substrate-binding protein
MKKTRCFLAVIFGIAITASVPAGGNSQSASTADPGVLEVTTIRSIDPNQRFSPGDSFEDNLWTRALLNEYKVKISYLWTAPQEQFSDRRSLMLATGDLPDIFELNAREFEQAMEADLLCDITDVYEREASAATRERMNIDGGALRAGSVNGRLYGLAQPGDYLSSMGMFFIRKDWLAKLGTAPPNTLDELIRLAVRFKNEDPDGNGVNDTLGIGFRQEDYNRFFNIMGGYPGWHAGPDGTIVNGIISPEIKEALGKMREMYAQGLIDREFYTKTGTNWKEDITNSRVGMYFGWYGSSLDQNDLWVQDHTKVFGFYPVPGKNAENDYKPSIGNGYAAYNVASKKTKYPEALIRALNLFVDKQSNDYSFIYDKDGISVWQLAPIMIHTPNNNLINQRLTTIALEKNDRNSLPAQAQQTYDNIINLRNGSNDPNDYFLAMVFGPDTATALMDKLYTTPGRYIQNVFYGAPTPAMVRYDAALQDMQNEVFTKIIIGDSPLSDFDVFVRNWKVMGGDEMTKEVNEWYKTIR